jgi:hypothetical protein
VAGDREAAPLRCILLASVALLLGGCGAGDDLVTIDRVGRADAPNTLTVQLNASYSPQASVPEVADGFRRLFTRWAEQHPDWRLDLNIIGGTTTTSEQARLLQKAKVGQAPDCANVDSLTIPRSSSRACSSRWRTSSRAGSCATCSPTSGTWSPGLTATSTRGGGRPTCACSGAAPTWCRRRRGPGTS